MRLYGCPADCLLSDCDGCEEFRRSLARRSACKSRAAAVAPRPGTRCCSRWQQQRRQQQWRQQPKCTDDEYVCRSSSCSSAAARSADCGRACAPIRPRCCSCGGCSSAACLRLCQPPTPPLLAALACTPPGPCTTRRAVVPDAPPLHRSAAACAILSAPPVHLEHPAWLPRFQARAITGVNPGTPGPPLPAGPITPWSSFA